MRGTYASEMRVRAIGLVEAGSSRREAAEQWQRLPVNVFGQERFENGLARLVHSDHCGPPCVLVA
jgi:hypothetical protein